MRQRSTLYQEKKKRRKPTPCPEKHGGCGQKRKTPVCPKNNQGRTKSPPIIDPSHKSQVPMIQSPPATLSLDSEWNWSLIVQRGLTATRKRPSQTLPLEVPTRNSQPQVGGTPSASTSEAHARCSHSLSRARWNDHRGHSNSMWPRVSGTSQASQRGDGRWPNRCRYTPVGKWPVKNWPTRAAINREGKACVQPKSV